MRTLAFILMLYASALPCVSGTTNDLYSLLPPISKANGYVTSQACLECHKDEHASWHKSYHRTMSQPALPQNIHAKFDGTVIDSDGLKYRVYQKGEELWAEMPDPDVMMFMVQGGKPVSTNNIPQVHQRVLLVTGSHHYHTFWVGSSRYDKLLQTLPLVYLIEDKKWVPRETVFMRGPDFKQRFITQWNHHCIRCHSTGGNPGLNEKTGQLETKVAEYGIACEACHGPGEKHVNLQKAFAAREIKEILNDPIVNPKKLSPKSSTQVCGQCHGAYIMEDAFAMDYAHNGVEYRPGDDLHKTRYYIQYPTTNSPPNRQDDLKKNPEFFRERWWDDGTILASGREYTALSPSKCYTQGDISCISCHSMHNSDPNDQLKRFKSDNDQCVQCHQEAKYNEDIAKHTFHLATSSGSNCLNCHMPHTTYGLLKGIRSHQIASPTITASARHGTPNACNLCHLDKTLGWSQEHLVKWYQHRPEELTAEQQQISAAVLWITQGNAAQRIIAAWHFGWEPAKAASGTNWMAPYLALLLDDPYGVVRYVGGKSLNRLPKFQNLGYDFTADSPRRKAIVMQVLNAWQELPSTNNAALLLGAQGQFLMEDLKELVKRRDHRPITIKE